MSKVQFGYRTTAQEALAHCDLSGKNAIVTGAYSGVGLETAKALASAGADVIIACRDLAKANKVAAEINESIGAARVRAQALDLGSLASVKTFTNAFLQGHTELHILINNAAVMACPFEKTLDGFESQFGINHLGHFALTTQLLPALSEAGGARVVCLSSTGHFLSPIVFDDIQFKTRDYNPWSSYGQSKTACALMALGIQSRYQEQNIEAFSVHPGAIMTTLQRHMSQSDIVSRGWTDEDGKVNEAFKTVEQGASTSVWAATAPELKGRGGRYLEDCKEADIHIEIPKIKTGVMQYAVNQENADMLWDLSVEMIAGFDKK